MSIHGFHNDAAPPQMGARDGQPDFLSADSRRELNDAHAVAKTLKAFGKPALRFAAEHGTQVRPLRRGERYAQASPALVRLGIDVDAWPAPPAGLFVVEERTVYVRNRSAMTVAHEFGHALDCALGGGIYLRRTPISTRHSLWLAAS